MKGQGKIWKIGHDFRNFAGILRESFNLYFFDIYEKISVFDDCRNGGDASLCR